MSAYFCIPTNLNFYRDDLAGRGFLTHPILGTPPILLKLLFQICPTPLALFVTLFLRLNVPSCHIERAILLNDIKDLNLLSLGTSVLPATCFVFYRTRHQIN